MKTLIDVMPSEYASYYFDIPARKFDSIEVTCEHGMTDNKRWPGKQKNVHWWVELANGYAVGWNENPSTGWSFPVIKMKSKND